MEHSNHVDDCDFGSPAFEKWLAGIADKERLLSVVTGTGDKFASRLYAKLFEVNIQLLPDEVMQDGAWVVFTETEEGRRVYWSKGA